MNNKEAFINFMAPIERQSAALLMSSITDKMNKGATRFTILISSPGGEVHFGINLYNFLKGIPAEIITHNFGSVDSVSTIIYCAGKTRYCSSNARFLIHGVTLNIPQGGSFEEKKIREISKSIEIDRLNISNIIAETCKKKPEDVQSDMFEGITLGSQKAKEYGLVHEIKDLLYPIGAEVIPIFKG